MTPPSRPAASSLELRADARRNRERILAAAAEAFASGAPSVSMGSIARRAGVGSGTLYRHFPTREDLIEEVYRDQRDRLRSGARDLLATRTPAHALQQWMELLADWAATKHGMREALAAAMASGRIPHSQMRAALVQILDEFLEAGARQGDLRGDVDAADLAAVLAGVLLVTDNRDDSADHDRLRRLLRLIVEGLLPHSASHSAASPTQ